MGRELQWCGPHEIEREPGWERDEERNELSLGIASAKNDLLR